jgi:hypothetical protein
MTDQDDCLPELVAVMDGDGCGALHQEGPISDLEVDAVERELGVLLPWSYRTFLRHFGVAWVAGHQVFGLPRHRLWGDVVLMNHLVGPALAAAYVMVSRDRRGQVYCLDTSCPRADGECPVVVLGPDLGGTPVARTFLEFLRKASRNEL